MLSEQQEKQTQAPATSQHTAEPWHALAPVRFGGRYGEAGDRAICDEGGAIIAEAFERVGQTDYRNAKANATRICACVNALAGVPTTVVESDGFRLALRMVARVAADNPGCEITGNMRAQAVRR